MSTREFFEMLFGEAEGFIFIGWFNDERELNQFKPVRYPDQLSTIESLVQVHKDDDLYFSPMLYTVPRRKKSTVCATPVLYADTDLFDPAGYRVQPTINVQTSPNKTHSYWVLDSVEYSPKEVSRVAKAIAHSHAEKGEDGEQLGVDQSGWDLTQLLRVPGTKNTKHDTPFPVTIANNTGEVYSIDDITKEYDPESVLITEITDAGEMPELLDDTSEVLSRLANNSKLLNLYTKTPSIDQDWSDTLYFLLSEMLREGYSRQEVFTIGWNAACNKYRRDGRPLEHFWKYDMWRAINDPKNQPYEIMETKSGELMPTTQTLNQVSDGIAKEVEELTLTPTEIANRTTTFVDQYVKWAKSKTDAPEPYHVAGALTILSLILGEWAVGDVQYGAQRLGMFFTILGETTDTRKSTSRSLMKRVIRTAQSGDYEYILTSDATEEGLIDALASRPYKSSLYDRDEVQKLVNDIKGGKGYMAGFFETLNELYDGWARGRIRAMKSTKDTPVNFVQYLMGIRSQFQENLTLEDFKSGWGPRNVFVRGESPPRTRENSRLQQGNNKNASTDYELLKLSTDLTDARTHWETKQRGDRESPFFMYFEEDAWIRQTDWEWDLKDHFANHPRYEYLKPCLERMSINIMKVCILFAMYEKCEKVNMSHVINAHYIACQWVEDLIVIVEGVAENGELKRLREVEQFIMSKKGTVHVAIILQWAAKNNMRRRDINEAIEALRDMDIIRIGRDTDNKAVVTACAV